MKPIGILGIGQAGGNIAQIASTLGFQTALINTNQHDGLVNTRVEKKYFVPGFNGAGQDRSIGLRAANDNYREMIDFVKQSFKDIKLLLVAFSTDGGTGSGMSPLLIDLLLDQLPGINIGAIAIVPERNVLAGNRINSAECIQEISKIEGISSVFLVDNDQMRKINPQSSKQQIYLASNYRVMEAINSILQVTQKSSFYGNFDETDLMNILNTRGVTIISSTTITDAKSTSDVSSKIHSSWANSIFCPVEATGVIRAGLIYDGPENMSKLINMPSIFERVGEPIQLFEGTYISESDPTITTILAGLPYPTRRLLALEESIEKNKDRLQNLVNKEHTQMYESRISWASNLRIKKPEKQANSVSSKLSKYQR
ncbi:cell division protein FtsZ [Peribacillus cavernae]|uniref:Cell division protein FtsZ n=1 Tax=Peribacillus cavernae TaxID=1674310 RepID=A0A3S1B0F5_9BACI|nr:cell division protein FtsZ [Peribacillus cavernae]MDQ0221386.1 cell division GTPase FtsZ [Peribacillus cavernae]RUQ23974.1 cell division protein FtsZ [Peribacillus cavernae]